MNPSSLSAFICQQATWYKSRGKRFKILSLLCRGVIWLFLSASALSMVVAGADALTAVLVLIAASAYGLDKTFNFTRNWLEFSAVEIVLEAANARIKFMTANGSSVEAIFDVFDGAVKAIEAETLHWKSDVRSGLEELRSLAAKGGA